VKVTVRFRGREMAHPELARNVLNLVADDIKAYANIDKPAQMEGRALTMIVSSSKALQRQPAGTQAPRPEAARNSAAPQPAGAANGASGQPVASPVRSPQAVA
jgi:translation initiation factor IF-3